MGPHGSTPIRVPVSALFCNPGTEKTNHDIVVFSEQNTGSSNRGTGEKKSLHRHGCASGFPKIHPKWSVDLKEISSGRQAVFQQVFFFQWYGEPLINRTLPYVIE